jgi:hypothetical protein
VYSVQSFELSAQPTVAMNQNDNKKPFKCKKPFNNGFRKLMHSEPRARISHPQPPTAAKRQNINLDITKALLSCKNKAQILNPWKVFKGKSNQRICASGTKSS